MNGAAAGLPSRPPSVPDGGAGGASVRQRADRLIAAIDRALSAQVNAIIHHPEFQRLEASWRSLHYLCAVSHDIEGTKVRFLPLSWRELSRDLTRAVEFDQSQIFDKVYNQEFGMPGGEPYGLLVGDYEIIPQQSHIDVLRELATVCAAAFAPLICGCSPAMFGFDSFAELGIPMDLGKRFQQAELVPWRNFQRDPARNDDLRFIGLTLPHVLVREPWADDGSRHDGFRFREEVDRDGRRGYLWSSAAFAFASVVMRAFGDCGWFTQIRGARRDVLGGGLVVDLPTPSFATDRPGVALKLSTDVEISERQERELSELGFIPLSRARYTPFSVFFGNQSIQMPRKFEEQVAAVNARLSSMMQYLLCVSRFAHYIKVMCRDRVGALATTGTTEDFLRRWLISHCVDNDDAADSVKARFPLKQANVEVQEIPGRPGTYSCKLWLQPHFQLDEISAGFRLVTELAASGSS